MYDIAICDDSAQDRSTLKDDIMNIFGFMNIVLEKNCCQQLV